MPNTIHPTSVVYDAKSPDAKYPPIEQLRPPKGAPNVLVILIDDAGFGSFSTFGGPCQTPILDKLASGGLRYNRFHTTALCSPTRQALLTGRNHHSAGMGNITETATGAPGYCSVLPKSMAPLAMTLKLNGYSTAQFGKCHEVPVWQASPAGPFDAWPTGGGGFEYFYGFIGGEANQWYPTLYEGTTPVELKKTPEEGYHLLADMTDKSIKWIAQQKALAPDKPFFIYFATGATHAPRHVPKEWADKYKGQFDQGWDKLREETYARQKQLGVIPADCRLTPRPKDIPSWDEMPEAMKPVLRRQMEMYAGFMEYTDYQVGRIIDVAPTILEEAGLPQPESVNGILQDPIEGVSMAYSCDDDVWELYSDKDWSQANDLSRQMPEKLRKLQRQFLIEAARYKVLPLDDRVAEKLDPDIAGRPVLVQGKTQLLFGGMGRLSETAC